jgi:hypothetical protein
VKRPWNERATELEPTEGAWCDYAAWREWFTEQEGKIVTDSSDILTALEQDCNPDAINLYTIFCNVFDAMPEVVEMQRS